MLEFPPTVRDRIVSEQHEEDFVQTAQLAQIKRSCRTFVASLYGSCTVPIGR